MPLSHELGQEIVDVYRGTHAFVQSESGEDFIDIDVAPESDSVPEISSYKDALHHLFALGKQIEVNDSESLFAYDKIRSTIWYIGHTANMDPKLEFPDLIQKTLGFMPRRTPGATIENSRQSLDGMLMDYGLKHDIELGYAPDYFEAYHEHFDIPANELDNKARSGVNRLAKFLTEKVMLSEGLNVPDLKKSAELRVEPHDEAWVGYFTTEGEDKKLTYIFNSHSRHQHTQGAMDLINIHELTHVADFSVKKKEIAAGWMNPVFGIATLHGPEILQAEFNAQASEHILPADTKKWEHTFQAKLNNHFTMVWNNAHIAVNTGTPPELLLPYLRRELPLHTAENHAKQLHERVSNPGAKIYFMAYEATLEILRRKFMELSVKKQLRDLGGSLFESRTYAQMNRHYAKLV